MKKKLKEAITGTQESPTKKEMAPQEITTPSDADSFLSSQEYYNRFSKEIQEWARAYYKVGYVPLICYQTKNPAYDSWEEFKKTRLDLIETFTRTKYDKDPSKACLGVTQVETDVRYMIIDIDNLKEFEQNIHEIDYDTKTLIAPTRRGFHALFKIIGYSQRLGDSKSFSGGELLFTHNAIVPPSSIGTIKRHWYYLSINEAIFCKETGNWGKHLTPDEFVMYIENNEIPEIDLRTFSLTRKYFEEKNERKLLTVENRNNIERDELIRSIKENLLNLNNSYSFYRTNYRHNIILRLSALCRKSDYQFSEEECSEILSVFINSDEEKKDRLLAIKDTYEKDLSEINYSDLFTYFFEMFGRDTAVKLYYELKKLFFVQKQVEQQQEEKKPKLQRFFESFIREFQDIIYRSGDLLFIWDGKYFKVLTLKEFTNIFLGFAQDRLNEVTTNYYAQQVYLNLIACSEIKQLPSWRRVIAFENKIFDLETQTFREHSMMDGNRFYVKADVIEDLFFEAMRFTSWWERFMFIIEKTTAFKKYIKTLEFDNDTLTQIIELGGYIMLPRLKEYNLEVTYILIGEGANGKSTLLSFIQRLFEGFYSTVSLSDLEGFSLSLLLNSYLNIANEITEKHDKAIAVENFKRTVSWDVMEIPIKFQQHIQTSLPLIHIFAVNQKPRVNEQTEAVYRRFLFIKFDKTLKEDERDREMLNKLLIEKNLIVTLFLLASVKIAQEKTLTNNKEMHKQTIQANNPVIDFLLENYCVSSDDMVKLNFEKTVQSIRDLRKEFNDWAITQKFYTNDSFRQALAYALNYLKENYSEDWGKVRILTDTQFSPEFKNKQRRYNVVFRLSKLKG